jgi:DNA-binding response OmpR family regulator
MMPVLTDSPRTWPTIRLLRQPRAFNVPKEFGVLELLLAAQGRVVSAEELLERAWDEMADPFTTAVKVTVSRLRRKLGEPPVIETMAQAGYRISP